MSETQREVAIGLDMGTSGARALALDLQGNLVASGRAVLPAEATAVDGPCVEQNPGAWWEAAKAALGNLSNQLPANTLMLGISVDATSGTFCLLDSSNRPVTPGIMYNDMRAADEAAIVAQTMAPALRPFGIDVGPSFALPKLVHLLRRDARLQTRARRMVHQTDWLIGHLTGDFSITDVSTALKTGADPGRMAWPGELEQLDVPASWLPRIVMPGTAVGRLTQSASESTGLPPGIPVVAGCTDGTAASLAAGVSHSGDLNVTLGTTLVFKGAADRPVIDPAHTVYNHRHPGGGYLPGAASNTGGQWMEFLFAGRDIAAMSAAAEERLPTSSIVYPLVARGERFPFSNPSASGFGWDQLDDPVIRFAACLEGTALLERLGIERLRSLDPAMAQRLLATGRAADHQVWMAIRATVNHCSYHVPALPESAVGAAILAAVPTFKDCRQAIRQMVRIDHVIDPNPAWQAAYDAKYEEFLDELKKRGWI